MQVNDLEGALNLLGWSYKAMTTNNPVTYNDAEKRYEMRFGDLVVYANVRRDKNTLYIDYVFAPQELRGKGAAGEFMNRLMDVARAEKLKAVPLCGYAASWLQRHSEYQDLVSD
jgi:predicted GNAT family acetyltransferase